jgi:hypothetical protein
VFPLCSHYPPPHAQGHHHPFRHAQAQGIATLGITCDLCQRREQFDVEALIAQHGGGVEMPDLRSRLVADCPRQQAFSIYHRCRAVYDRASRYR